MLDCGCGGGANIKRLLKRCPRGIVKGVDYPLSASKKSRRLNAAAIQRDRCVIWQGSVQRIIFASDWFDAVTAFETVYFLAGPCKVLPGGLAGFEAGWHLTHLQ